MRHRNRRFRRARKKCPECGAEKTLSWRKNVRRFKARLYGCRECDFVGTRGMWEPIAIGRGMDDA